MTQTPRPPSPYIVGTPILDPGNFYGRKREKQRFFADICRLQTSSIMVLGARRSGKTSFLRHVSRPDVYGPELSRWDMGNSVVMAYQDLQGRVTDLTSFYGSVAEAIHRALPEELDVSPPGEIQSSRNFERWLRLVPKGLRIVVLLDEVETLLDYDSFDSAFWNYMRAIAADGLVWVTSSHRSLHYLTRRFFPSPHLSPLYNVFGSIIHMGAIDPGEAERMICGPAATRGIEISTDEVKEIRFLSGGLPSALQYAAERWFYARHRGLPPEHCSGTVHDRLMGSESLLRHHFSSWWRGFRPAERALCLDLAKRDLPRAALDERQCTQLEELGQYGFISLAEGVYRLAGDTFRHWILRCSRQNPERPVVFVGHGGHDDWLRVSHFLSKTLDLEVEAFESQARAGQDIAAILDEMLLRAEFAVLVFTAEDEMADGTLRPRQNVVHELGLFQARLGFERVVILREKTAEVLSNMAGTQRYDFEPGQIRQTFPDLHQALRERSITR